MQTAVRNSSTIYIKTVKGHEEITRRSHGLNPRQRRVLIVIDGTRNMEALTQMIAQSELDEILPLLVQERLIAPVERQGEPPAGNGSSDSGITPAPILDPVRIREIKDFMTTTAHTYLGLLGAEVIQRIERAKDAAQLLPVVGHWHMALRDSKQGGRFAEPYLEQVKGALHSGGQSLERIAG